ncbi:uncharacterized protein [Bactrocera oleae]|uniref:uncharacterized protein n=1 Tax=Bactrocera oleae TaxID=104688 RepID=UPI00387EA54B
MINKSIRVFLTKNLNSNPYEAYGDVRDYIVTEAHEYMVFKREIVQIENAVYQGFELKARSLKDILNGQLFYYCPCRCGFVYDTNLVPHRPIAVEYIPQPGQVEPQDFELKQYFLDIQRQQHGHQPQLLQQLMEQPHQFMMQYQNYISQHHAGFLHLRAPLELGRPCQHFKAAPVKIGAQHPQVVEPLQNLNVSNYQQLAAAEEEVDVQTDEDELEEQDHIVVDDEHEQLEVFADDEEGEREKEVEEKEHIVIVDQKEEKEEQLEIVADDEEEERKEEVEEKEHIVIVDQKEEEEEQLEVVADNEEEEEEEEGEQEHIVDDDDKEEEFEEHEPMDISDEEEEEENEHMEFSDEEEEREHIAPPPFQEQQQDVAEEEDEDEIEEEEEEQERVLPQQLQAKPIQCYAISSTSSDDSDEEAIFMHDGFPPAVHDCNVIQSRKISSTTKVDADESDYLNGEDGEIDWSTDSADEDYY